MDLLIASSGIVTAALLAAGLPLGSFLGMFFGIRKPYLAIVASTLSFVFAVFCFSLVWNGREVHEQVNWFTLGDQVFTAGVLLNNLSVLMMLLVSGIALLVHIYSTAYMKDDPGLARYWGYLGLFCFAMMALVMADNLLVLYGFWELVGLSSYLLIGFWFTREAAARANKKAFIINRIGDLGFFAGMLILYTQFQTLDISLLFGRDGWVSHAVVANGWWISTTNHLPAIWLTLAGAGLFCGAMAKSAQFPFHTWLPDAMEGPTSVSSLIHAATMVAAGVFLVARVYPVFNPDVLMGIAIVGAFTAFMAATIAVGQNDLKKILAYSTVSQLGLMMVAAGTGTPASAMLHLVSHAFFKCLLFLGAGAVIHEMQHLKQVSGSTFDPQDIRNMGGLRDRMPVTFLTMLLAAAALAGFPFTSGFLSKDQILTDAFLWAQDRSFPALLIPVLATLASVLTAYYIGRLIFTVFFGQFRLDERSAEAHIHEAPAAMRIPMLVLAAGCLFPPFSTSLLHAADSWIMVGLRSSAGHVSGEGGWSSLVPVVVTILAIAAMSLAWVRSANVKSFDMTTASCGFLQQGWYFNSLQERLVVRPVLLLSRLSSFSDQKAIDGLVHALGYGTLSTARLSVWLDRYVVDAAVNFMGTLSKSIGNFIRRFQTGRVQGYLFLSLALMLLFFIIKFLIQAL